MKPVLLIALLVSVVAILSSPALCYDCDYCDVRENAEVIAPGFVNTVHHPTARIAGRSVYEVGPIIVVVGRVVTFPAGLIKKAKPLRRAVKGGRLILPRRRCCRQ